VEIKGPERGREANPSRGPPEEVEAWARARALENAADVAAKDEDREPLRLPLPLAPTDMVATLVLFPPARPPNSTAHTRSSKEAASAR